MLARGSLLSSGAVDISAVRQEISGAASAATPPGLRQCMEGFASINSDVDCYDSYINVIRDNVLQCMHGYA